MDGSLNMRKILLEQHKKQTGTDHGIWVSKAHVCIGASSLEINRGDTKRTYLRSPNHCVSLVRVPIVDYVGDI